MIEPYILRETDEWAAVVKPQGMPSAPLPGREEGTVLSWFLSQRPEAGSVIGKKPIERGLIHRLDTATWGLVVVAKTQAAYDRFAVYQGSDLISKRYVAICRESDSFPNQVSRFLDGSTHFPVTIASKFRPWGPKGREVRPLFSGDRGFKDALRVYTTILTSLERLNRDSKDRQMYRATCVLTRGYRHQIRAHLAFSGFPIVCDDVYSPFCEEGPLGLYAVEISFPSLTDDRREIVSLQPPDRMIP